VFLPVDQAWKTLGLTEKYLLSDTAGDSLKQVLLHSILKGVHYSKDFPSTSKTFTSLNGEKVDLYTDRDHLIFDGTRFTMDEKDILATNGVAHSLSSVPIPSDVIITPENLINATGSTSWHTILTETNSTEFLNLNSNYTLLIPTDEALSSSPLNSESIKSLINFHIIPPINGQPIDLFSSSKITTLSGQTIIIRKVYTDIYSIHFNSTNTVQARILDQGKTSNGAQILLIDGILFDPVGGAKLHWAKPISVIIFAVAMIVIIASGVGFIVRWWQRRREMKPLFHGENSEEAEPFLNGGS